MSTQSIFGTELKTKLLEGITKLNNSVSSTLGPAGRTVLIDDKTSGIRVTKDGVSVAKAFAGLEDEIENIGAQLVKQVAIKSANEAGDGTTTSTLLTTVMVQEGLKLITQGTNPVEIKKGIDKYVKLVIAELKKLAVDIDSEEQIRQVAIISGNNDEEVGDLISSAIDEVGRDGIITLEESKTGETVLDFVEGMQFDKGYKSPYFVTNNNTMQAVLDDAYIFIYDGNISTAAELLQVLTKANAENKGLLLVAHDFGDEALATLIVNKMRGITKVVAVKAPDFGERRTLLLEDMATLTGGQVISKDKGMKLEKLLPNQLQDLLGKARTVTVDKETTTIVDGQGSQEAIEERAAEIKEQIEKATSFFEKEKLQERLGKLIGGVAIISIGGSSEIEIKEKKDRVEDALYATKAALAEGTVEGGGIALIKAFEIVQENTKDAGTFEDSLAKEIVQAACYSPFKKILSNAGIDNHYLYLNKVLNSGIDNVTLDAKTKTVVDARKAGIIDPVKVTRLALENAASVAGTVLTTESVIFEKKEKESEQKSEMPFGF
jgi:chaperonin GroEL